MPGESKTVVRSEGREIVVTRQFDAPRDVVFDLWSDPAHITHWWGPVGFSTTTQAFDFRPGGVWRHVMHGPDGRDYDNEVRYGEIVRPERITYTHVSAPVFDADITFNDIGGRTGLTFRMTFATEELRRAIGESGANDGLRDTVDRLNDYVLQQKPADDETFVITRTFDAPRDLVWRAWTERDRLLAWFSPKGMTMTTATLDLRPGGVFHGCMKSPDGAETWGKWVFREVDPPNKLVWAHSFSDASGNLTRHPMSADWPLELLTTVTFEPDGDRTILTLTWTPINATPAERKVFKENMAGMTQGWGGTFENFEAYLRETPA